MKNEMNHRGGDDHVEHMVRAFFQSEMPREWPGAPATRTSRSDARSALPSMLASSRSRWALAASVAVLVGGMWLVNGLRSTSRPGDRPFNPDGGMADKNAMEKLIPKAGKVDMP